MKQPTPVLITAWWKEAGKDGKMWADSRFVCVTADRARVGKGTQGVPPTSDGARMGWGRLGKVFGLVFSVGVGVVMSVGFDVIVA